MTEQTITVQDEDTTAHERKITELNERVSRANTRAFNADQALERFKTEISEYVGEYIANHGECSDITAFLENFGLELPSKTVSFTVITRTYVTLTVPQGEDAEDSSYLEGLVSVNSDGGVEISGDVTDVDFNGADLDCVEDVELR